MQSRLWDYKRSIFEAVLGRETYKGSPALGRRPPRPTGLNKEKRLLAALFVFLLFLAEGIGVLAALFVFLLFLAKGIGVLAALFIFLLLVAVHEDVATLLLFLLRLFPGKSWGAERHCDCHCHDCHHHAFHNKLPSVNV